MTREFPKNNPPENPSPKIALPTVGRIVHVYLCKYDTKLAAVVAKVFGGGLRINACVINEDGSAVGVMNIPHASERTPDEETSWDWMDFQKGQAAKTEALEAQLKSSFGGAAGGGLSGAFNNTPQGNELGKAQAGAPSPVDGKR